jgi:DNA-directed RNA polymerase subunit RPC12/RpoP
MIKCGRCGGKLRRVHRTFLERFQYLAIYECLECDTEQCIPRPYLYHFGPNARCPRCGTLRLGRLKERDRIDGMRRGPMNVLNRLRGGKLAHCRFCRLQFYDRRPVASGPQDPPPAAGGPQLDTANL